MGAQCTGAALTGTLSLYGPATRTPITHFKCVEYWCKQVKVDLPLIASHDPVHAQPH